MALLCNVRTIRNTSWIIVCRVLELRRKSATAEIDPLDTFTTQLVQERSNKWCRMLIKNTTQIKVPSEIQKKEKLSSIEMLRTSIEENNIHDTEIYLKLCLNENEAIPESILLTLLSYFAQIGYTEGLELIQNNCKTHNISNQTQIYLAEVTWVNGNVPKALAIFDELYRNNKPLRRSLRRKFIHLFNHAALKNSEAIMIAIMKFSEDLTKDFKDYDPLVILWKICFLSEWYSDQILAMEMLQRDRDLLKFLLPQVFTIAFSAMLQNKIEAMYKLLEILLKYDCKDQCSTVLVALLDYKLRHGDLYSCTQILQWSSKYDVLLPEIQQEKALQILLKIKPDRKLVKRKNVEKRNYNLKF